MQKFLTVDDYMKQFSEPVLSKAAEMRQIIKEILPAATEVISYNIPAYKIERKPVVYFAGFKGHIGMYPGHSDDERYKTLLGAYASGKATAKFPITEILPRQLIKQFIHYRLEDLGITQ